MNINMFSRFARWNKRSEGKYLGVYLAPDLAWVYQPATAEQPAVEMEFKLDGDWKQIFSNIAEEFSNLRLRLVLSADWYQLLPIDRPQGDEKAIANSLLWAVKDMVSLPVQDLHLDYFELALPNAPQVYALVLDKPVLQQLVHGIIEAGMSLEGITIDELAICHAVPKEPQFRLIISQYPDQDLLFTVVHDGELLMHRRVRGFSDIQKSISDEVGGRGTVDNLSLELQRSMDYFVNQLRQPPVAAVDILIDGADEAFAKQLGANFNQPVTVLPSTSVGTSMAQYAFDEWSRED
ncbi:MAG: MSHA biogenesis protein MshI [Shewanella sp.]|nr:MSHA biogenesis protein MshI [Shewanella sp.]MCF1429486.1 MSHA biogenesis protein MshI [Shewanella sp.]MCF1439597.1 MSHA biogenesis protein MshI [Shewanella sp.]MCF1457669.1 MSHA biogenesis protein MshI [Shewanella sp.]